MEIKTSYLLILNIQSIQRWDTTLKPFCEFEIYFRGISILHSVHDSSMFGNRCVADLRQHSFDLIIIITRIFIKFVSGIREQHQY